LSDLVGERLIGGGDAGIKDGLHGASVCPLR
jgi:hypothetical protein